MMFLVKRLNKLTRRLTMLNLNLMPVSKNQWGVSQYGVKVHQSSQEVTTICSPWTQKTIQVQPKDFEMITGIFRKLTTSPTMARLTIAQLKQLKSLSVNPVKW